MWGWYLTQKMYFDKKLSEINKQKHGNLQFLTLSGHKWCSLMTNDGIWLPIKVEERDRSKVEEEGVAERGNKMERGQRRRKTLRWGGEGGGNCHRWKGRSKDWGKAHQEARYSNQGKLKRGEEKVKPPRGENPKKLQGREGKDHLGVRGGESGEDRKGHWG
jgi:hypothetical protein